MRSKQQTDVYHVLQLPNSIVFQNSCLQFRNRQIHLLNTKLFVFQKMSIVIQNISQVYWRKHQLLSKAKVVADYFVMIYINNRKNKEWQISSVIELHK